MAGYRGDKSHAALAALHGKHLGGASLRAAVLHGIKAHAALGLGPDVCGRPERLRPPEGAAAHGHKFDKAQVNGHGAHGMNKIVHLPVIDAAHGNGVDFYANTRLQQPVQRGENRGQQVAPGHSGKGFAVKTIEGKIYGAHPH